MIAYLVAIIIAAFLQTTVINLQLSLMILLSAALLRRDNLALYLSLFAGILIGTLSGINLGYYSLVYLAIVQGIRIYRRAPIHGNILFIAPAAVSAFFVFQLASLIYLHTSLDLVKIIFDSLIFVAFYWLIQFFEDRLNSNTEIKLRLK